MRREGWNREISKLDDACISNPEIRNGRLDWQWPPRSNLRFRISGFEIATGLAPRFYARTYSLSPASVGFIAFEPFFQFAGQTSP